VLLDGGPHATLLSHRFPASELSIGDEIEAVTVLYIRSRKSLHLSMRRNFALARTMPRTGRRLLRRNDHQWQMQLERQRPVEIVLEGPHTVRVFGATAEAVRETACELDHQVPWTASAVITTHTPEFKPGSCRPSADWRNSRAVPAPRCNMARRPCPDLCRHESRAGSRAQSHPHARSEYRH